MNKLKLLGGSAVVTSTVLFASAGAFAAAPSSPFRLGHDPGLSSVIHRPFGRVHGMSRFVKVRDAVAQILGLTPEQLKSELQTKTLDQLAAEHGMSRAELMQQALKNAGFSDEQIQKIVNAMAKVPHDKMGLLRLR